MYTQRKGIKSARNQIIITSDGERIDLRKVSVGRIKHQGRYEGNKYGARSAKYEGVTYHSTAEAKYAQQLNLRLKAHEFKSWEGQVRMPLIVNGFSLGNYIVDFRIDHHDGTKEYIEIKGMMTSTAALKIKLFEALYCNDAKGIKFALVKV